MDKKLFDLISDDIKNRNSWAERQAVWYQLRRDGLRRRNKPFPGCADLHYPLVDSTIDKFKPFYSNQLFATERLADFISKDPQAGDLMTDAAWHFDWQLKQNSNLEKQANYAIDYMLQGGRGLVKVTWDADEKQLCFDAVEPIYLIVPGDTDDLQKGDRLVHVQHLSEWKYLNGPGSDNRKKDADFVQRIKGGQTQNEAQRLEDAKARKEGITYSQNKDTIILWEIYQRTKEGIKVFTISPSAPDDDVRPPFMLPYRHKFFPFVDFTMEESDKSYYSPRGVAEILAAFESSLCKQWNEKHDAMTFYNRPIYTSDRDIPTTGNIRMRPGEIIPYNIQTVKNTAPPISWDQEMLNTRSIAEQRIAVPDFGVGKKDNLTGSKTATEIEAITAFTDSMIDMRSRIFRRQLGALYLQAWELLKQYCVDFSFLSKGELKDLDKKAWDAVATIRPNGSSDAWNQQRRLKKAVGRKTLFANSPYINQAELEKSILELDEPGLVERLFVDPGVKEQSQAQRQMLEIPALEDGLPITPNPDDDDAVHVHVLMGHIAKSAQVNKPATPDGIQAINQHLQAHMERLHTTNPKVAGQLQKALREMQAKLSAPAQGQGQLPQQQQPEAMAA